MLVVTLEADARRELLREGRRNALSRIGFELWGSSAEGDGVLGTDELHIGDPLHEVLAFVREAVVQDTGDTRKWDGWRFFAQTSAGEEICVVSLAWKEVQ